MPPTTAANPVSTRTNSRSGMGIHTGSRVRECGAAPLPVRVVARLAEEGSSLIRCRRQRIGARGNGRGSYYDGTIISPYLQCSNWEQSFITINLFKNMYGDYMWTTGQRQVKICQMNQEREELYNIILYQGKHQSGLTTAGRHTTYQSLAFILPERHFFFLVFGTFAVLPPFTLFRLHWLIPSQQPSQKHAPLSCTRIPAKIAVWA